MDEAMDRLDKRTQRLVKGSKVYKDGVGGMSQHQMDFAEALEGFCGGTDEESLLLGTLSVQHSCSRRLCRGCLPCQRPGCARADACARRRRPHDTLHRRLQGAGQLL